MRLGETSTLFRNEESGEMHGLIRVRQFTISEGHIILRPEQLEEEFKNCLELANFMLKTVGLSDDVSYRFSQWDPDNKDKFEGTAEQWVEAQTAMKKILDHLNLEYSVGIGEAAFYGPKLDIQIRNVHGKEDTLITIQIDQLLAEKFGMKYTDTDGKERIPYIIHRTSIGCYERTLALLIEKFAGAFPLWLAPEQIRIIPVADRHLDYVYEFAKEFKGFKYTIDDRAEKVGYKIRQAQLEKIPYMLVIGDNECENKNITVRSRKDGDLGVFELNGFIERINDEINNKSV
jgi:threonyl-tRNA synthetase